MTFDPVVPSSPTDFATRLVELVTTEGRAAVVLTGPVGMGKSHTLQLLTDRLSRAPAKQQISVVCDPGQSEQIHNLLTVPNSERPGLVIADDLDRWPEPLLRQLAGGLDRRQVTVIGSARSERARQLFSQFRPARTPTVLDLPPCTAGSFVAHVQRRLHGRLHSVTATRLTSFSGGNRLCLSELIDQGIYTGRLRLVDSVWWWDGPVELPPVTFARRWSELVELDSDVLDVLISLPDARPMPLTELAAVHSRDMLQAAEQAGLIVADIYPDGPMIRVRRELDRLVVWAGVPFLRRREIVAHTTDQFLHRRRLAPQLGLSVARLAHQMGQRIPPAMLRAAAVEILRHHDPAELVTLASETDDPVVARWAELAGGQRLDPGRRKGNMETLCTAAWTGRKLPEAFARACELLARGHHGELLVLTAMAIGLQLARLTWCAELYATLGDRKHWSAAGHALLDAMAGFTAFFSGDLDEADRIATALRRAGTTRPWLFAHALGTLLLGYVALTRALRQTAERHLTESAVSARATAPELGLTMWARSAVAVGRARIGDGLEVQIADSRAPRLVSLLIDVNTAENLLQRDLRPAALRMATTLEEEFRDHPLGALLSSHLLLRVAPDDPENARNVIRQTDRADFALARVVSQHARAVAAGDLPTMARVAADYANRGMRWLAAETAATTLARSENPPSGTSWAMASRGLIDDIRKDADDAVPPWWGKATTGIGTLTARESEVARVAASGQTSAQIARLLGVSPRTVENHLQSVFRKLGIRGRAQLPEALRQIVPRACEVGDAAR